MYIQVNNMNFNGIIDYKGLDISMFIPSTQLYDFEENVFLVNTRENVQTTTDIQIITEEAYLEYKEMLEERRRREEEDDPSVEDRLNDVELAILELAGVIE